jgi:hypothetical protein
MITLSLRIVAAIGGTPRDGFAGQPDGRPRRPAPHQAPDPRGATPRLRPAAGGLEDFPPARAVLPAVALAAAAARGVAAGTGYQTGQLGDRAA